MNHDGYLRMKLRRTWESAFLVFLPLHAPRQRHKILCVFHDFRTAAQIKSAQLGTWNRSESEMGISFWPQPACAFPHGAQSIGKRPTRSLGPKRSKVRLCAWSLRLRGRNMITMSFFAVGKIIAERWRIQYFGRPRRHGNGI